MNKLCIFLFLTVLIGRDLNQSLQIAGDNILEIKKAMSSVPLNQSKGMQWLITHMPTEDLKNVKAELGDVKKAAKELGDQLEDVVEAAKGKARKGRKPAAKKPAAKKAPAKKRATKKK